MFMVVVGQTGREHALAHVLSRHHTVRLTLGNPGYQFSTSVSPERMSEEFYVIGPEAPLIDGLADRLRKQGKLVFGPGADGAMFEGSKRWMKEFFVAAGIPTARYAAFAPEDLANAELYLEAMSGGYVIKTDRPPASRDAVLVTSSYETALADVRAKAAGGLTLLIEELMEGPEFSAYSICDGNVASTMQKLVRDYKRLKNGDEGPNTGSMGSYAPFCPPEYDYILEWTQSQATRTLAECWDRGIDYRGVLYAGGMLTPDGAKMVEYNVRFGDTETQSMVPLVSNDLGQVLYEAAGGHLKSEVEFTDEACVTITLAAEGYPEAPVLGDVITGVEEAGKVPGVVVFHAGTKRQNAELVTARGRVLNVTAVAQTLAEARERAYEAVAHIKFRGMQYRTDIAAEA
jgi:phosphoribosylamine---glycine ligase